MLQKIFSVLIILIIHAAIYTITEVIEKKLKKKKNIELSFSLQIFKIAIIVSAIIFSLLRFEIIKELSTTLIAGSSLIVAVLGFAAQESLNNVISGVMIAKSKPFDIGERVILEEYNITGTIVDITLRHTVVRKFNNATVIVPNSIMNKAVIENSSCGENEIANFMDISVSYESDINKAMEIISDTIKSHELFLNSKDSNVMVRDLGPEGYSVRGTVWTNTISENFEACSDIRVGIKKRFDEEGIEIPYNHIHLVK